MNRVGGATAACDFYGCSAHQQVDVGVPTAEGLRELGWYVGKGPDPILFCPTHRRQDVAFPAHGIYPHCAHCRPCRSELVDQLHYRPCQHDIACAGAKPA